MTATRCRSAATTSSTPCAATSNIKILLFNNQIYGLTKGQYSPTSEVGKRDQVEPGGLDRLPVQPGEPGARAPRPPSWPAPSTWTASTPPASSSAAYEHTGSAFVEIYQNCNVFNDKAFIKLTGREERDANRIYLEPGEPIVFGAEKEKGIVLDRDGAKIVDVADVGIDAIHVHDPANTGGVAYVLSRLSHSPTGPTPIGVFRRISRPSYQELVQSQIIDAQARKGPGDLGELLRSAGTWTVS